jgi:glycosyltransferase involved in cell wall biosynthesis
LAENLVLPSVEVLLATLNGEKYLPEFLKSLSQQTGVEIHLRVSDDGSTDNTLKIVDTYRNDFKSTKVSMGPKSGVASNFFLLMQESRHNYVAFADQDDIWLPHHLVNSIKRIEAVKNQSSPILSISKLFEFSETRKIDLIWPKKDLAANFPTLFYENVGRGCSMVMNRSLVEIVNRSLKDFAIMHDWWVLLLAWLHGEVVISQEAEINYRIHPSNTIGNPKINLLKLPQRAIKSKLGGLRHAQISSLYLQYCDMHLGSKNFLKLDSWFHVIHSPLYRKAIIFRGQYVTRGNSFHDFLMKLAILFSECATDLRHCKKMSN